MKLSPPLFSSLLHLHTNGDDKESTPAQPSQQIVSKQ
jgi:hypothetical protein